MTSSKEEGNINNSVKFPQYVFYKISHNPFFSNQEILFSKPHVIFVSLSQFLWGFFVVVVVVRQGFTILHRLASNTEHPTRAS